MTKNKVFNAIGLSEIRFIYGNHKPQIVVTRKGFCQGKADKKECGDLQYVFFTKPRLQPQHLLCYKPWLTNKNTSICQKTFKMSDVLDA